MASYLRPRRGKKATALSQNITLKAGEVFFETPTTGVGTGAGRIMMGNGSNNYTYLNNNKKAFITDINCPDCYISNFTATDGDTTLTNNTTYLNNMKPGATASTFFTNLWRLLSSHNKQLTQLNNDLLNKVYPVGSIYMSVNSTSPATLFGGTWVAITAGYYLKSITSGTGGTYTNATNVGSTTLTVNQITSHAHSISNSHYQVGDKGGGGNWGYAIDNAGGGNVTGDPLIARSTGGGQSHTHSMGTPATMTVYMWKRTK